MNKSYEIEAERTIRLNLTPDEAQALKRGLNDAIDAAHETALKSNLVADYDAIYALRFLQNRLVDNMNADFAARKEVERLFPTES